MQHFFQHQLCVIETKLLQNYIALEITLLYWCKISPPQRWQQKVKIHTWARAFAFSSVLFLFLVFLVKLDAVMTAFAAVVSS